MELIRERLLFPNQVSNVFHYKNGVVFALLITLC